MEKNVYDFTKFTQALQPNDYALDEAFTVGCCINGNGIHRWSIYYLLLVLLVYYIILSIIDIIPRFGFTEIHMQWLKDLADIIGYIIEYIT